MVEEHGSEVLGKRVGFPRGGHLMHVLLDANRIADRFLPAINGLGASYSGHELLSSFQFVPVAVGVLVNGLPVGRWGPVFADGRGDGVGVAIDA